MIFNDILVSIKSITPSNSFELDVLHDKNPIVLSEEDINRLVDYAIKFKPRVMLGPAKKTIDLLTLLLSVGTESSSFEKDQFLGLKDHRIEECIIEKAKERVKQTADFTSAAAVFGLSGNPPTMNHLILIQHLMNNYDTVHLILNAQSPLKNPISYLPAEIRLEMLEAMLVAQSVDLDKCKIERLEIDRDPPSRMIGTISLLVLNSDFHTKFTLVLGMDSLYNFKYWYKWEQYGTLCNLKFYPREGILIDINYTISALSEIISQNIHVTLVYNSPEQKEIYDKIKVSLGDRITFSAESIETFEGSSSEIRDLYASGTIDANSATHCNIHPVVDSIIKQKELYGYVLPQATLGCN